MEFSTPTIHRLIKVQDSYRVSKDAANDRGELLERFAGDIAEEAVALAEEDVYQTVRHKHIRQALR